MEAPKDFSLQPPDSDFPVSEGACFLCHYHSHLKHSLTCNYFTLKHGAAQHSLIAYTAMQIVCKHQEWGVQSRVEQIQIIWCTLYETV